MNNTEGNAIQHGPTLMAYLDAEWLARGMTQTAFARENRMDNSQFSRWRAGGNPKDIDILRHIAEALGKSLVEILVAAGILRPDEVGGIEIAPPEAPSIDKAIELDPSLSEDERATLRIARQIAQQQRVALEAARRRVRPRVSTSTKGRAKGNK